MKTLRVILAFVASPFVVAVLIYLAAAPFDERVATKSTFAMIVLLVWLIPSFLLVALPAYVYLRFRSKNRLRDFALAGAVLGMLVGVLPGLGQSLPFFALTLGLGVLNGSLSAAVLWLLSIWSPNLSIQSGRAQARAADFQR